MNDELRATFEVLVTKLRLRAAGFERRGYEADDPIWSQQHFAAQTVFEELAKILEDSCLNKRSTGS